MKSILMVLSGVLLLSSCEVDKGDAQSGNREMNPPKARNYTTAELSIGRNICSALKFKREKMGTITHKQERFHFAVESKACTSTFPSVKGFEAEIHTNSITPKYVSTSTVGMEYFQDVVNDESNLFKTLCENLSVTDSVSNVMTSGSSYYMINLLVLNNYETVELKKQTKNGSGQYPHVSTEIISFLTMTSQAEAKFMGIEKERTLQTICPTSAQNTNSYSYVKQIWNRAITSY